jgi:transposase
VHAAVDTLGNLLALLVTPANEQDRAQVGELAHAVQEATGQSVELAFVDQGYTGEAPVTLTGLHLQRSLVSCSINGFPFEVPEPALLVRSTHRRAGHRRPHPHSGHEADQPGGESPPG